MHMMGSNSRIAALYRARTRRSQELYERARQVIPAGLTHDSRALEPYPLYAARAGGPRKWDVDGNEYVDYFGGHGALLLGHAHPVVMEAICEQAALGTHWGAGHELEVRWAELIHRLVPSAERVRFLSSGTEASHLALRLARAFTGRPKVIRFVGHFHGWHDGVAAGAHSHFDGGVPIGIPGGLAEESVLLPAEDTRHLGSALAARNDVAAVILEPSGASWGQVPLATTFLEEARRLTRANGVVLIFDEVITGFRWSRGGAQARYGVIPDLSVLAKIVAGGLPGGVLGGRVDVMAVLGDGTRFGKRTARVPHTGTFNANPLSAAAGITLLKHVEDGEPQETARLAAERLVAGINREAGRHGVDVHAYTNGTSIYHLLIGARRAGVPLGPSHAVAHLHRDRPAHYALLRRALLVEGVDTHPVHGWISATHDDATIDEAVDAFGRAFARIHDVEGFALAA